MDAVAELKKQIKEMEKHLSLRQIALQSGINYITLRNIKFGKSSRVTEGVMQRLSKFFTSFDAVKAVAKAAPKKRGRKKGSTMKPAATPAVKPAIKPAGKKRGRKPGVKAPAATAPATTAPSVKADSVTSALNKQIADLENRLAAMRKIRDDYAKMMG